MALSQAGNRTKVRYQWAFWLLVQCISELKSSLRTTCSYVGHLIHFYYMSTLAMIFLKLSKTKFSSFASIQPKSSEISFVHRCSDNTTNLYSFTRPKSCIWQIQCMILQRALISQEEKIMVLAKVTLCFIMSLLHIPQVHRFACALFKWIDKYQ